MLTKKSARKGLEVLQVRRRIGSYGGLFGGCLSGAAHNNGKLFYNIVSVKAQGAIQKKIFTRRLFQAGIIVGAPAISKQFTAVRFLAGPIIEGGAIHGMFLFG